MTILHSHLPSAGRNVKHYSGTNANTAGIGAVFAVDETGAVFFNTAVSIGYHWWFGLTCNHHRADAFRTGDLGLAF